MGKSQSKLSPEQLADLQKNTYCKPVNLLVQYHQSNLSHPEVDKKELQQWSAVAANSSSLLHLLMRYIGTRDSLKTARLVN